MILNKANFNIDGDQLTLGMDFLKVDKERRQVVGFAVLDNVDQQGDIVLPEATREAFAKFKKNLREMHQPIAAGRVVDFREDTFFDPETQQAYTGMLVTAYVSKGAQPTWEKVLDGTLTGFSIGGKLGASDRKVMKNQDGGTQVVRIVKSYQLDELSLVDNPANQLSNILSIVKMNDGLTKATGIAAETEGLTVFWCDEDRIAKTSSDVNADCTICGTEMAGIGWFELGSDTDVNKMISSAIEAHNKIEKQEVPADEGGVEVADVKDKDTTSQNKVDDETGPTDIERDFEVGPQGSAVNEDVEDLNKSVEAGEEAVAPDAADVDGEVPADDEPDAEEAAGDEADAAAAGDSEAVGTDFAKVLDELKSLISNGLQEHSQQVAEQVQKAVDGFAVEVGQLVEKHAELVVKQEELAKKVDSATESFATVSKRLDDVESGGAIKKSADLGGSVEGGSSDGAATGTWRGTFLDAR